MPRTKPNCGPTLPSLASKKSSIALDGHVAELFKKVYKPLDPSAEIDHLDGLRSLHQKILKIQKLERSRVPHEKLLRGEDRIELLSSWIHENGIKLDGIKLAAGFEEGCGVVATKKFEPGQLITTVPVSLMMTTLTAMESQEDVGLLCKNDPWLCQVPSLILTMHLLFEKHKTEESPSRWKGYIKSLPGLHCLDESNGDDPEDIIMPLSFSVSTIEVLVGTLALEELHKMTRTILKQYCHIYLLLQRHKNLSPSISNAASWFNFAEFRWAASTVMMRQHQIPLPDDKKSSIMALVPILDMFNHEEGPITNQFNTDKEIMEVNSKRRFQEGEQIYISYGRRPNVMLLLYSGFLSPKNPRDKIRFLLELPTSDSLYSKKVALLKWLKLPPAIHLDLFCDGEPSRELMTWIKVVGLEDLTAIDMALRSAIALRAEETAQMLRSQASIKENDSHTQGNGESDIRVTAVQALVENLKSSGKKEKENGVEGKSLFSKEKDGIKDIMEGPFAIHHWKIFSSLCESKLKAMGCSVSFDESRNVNVMDKISIALSQEIENGRISREKHLAFQTREIEVNALKSAIKFSEVEIAKVSN